MGDLNAMERSGLVSRERLAENRRVERIELTAKGERSFLKLREAAMRRAAQWGAARRSSGSRRPARRQAPVDRAARQVAVAKDQSVERTPMQWTFASPPP